MAPKRNKADKKRKRKVKKKEREVWKRTRKVMPEFRMPEIASHVGENASLLLYHGTSGRRAEIAWIDGLIPRSNGHCNWPDRPGRSDCNYLTSVWARMYALQALGQQSEQNVKEGAIIEFRGLDESLLLPDEDFLFECVTMSFPESETARLRDWLLGQVLPGIRNNLENYVGRDWLEKLSREYGAHPWTESIPVMSGWKASLTCLGTCAYKGPIASSFIKRIAYFPKDHPVIQDARRLKPTTDEHRQFAEGLKLLNGWIFQENQGPDHIAYKNRKGFRLCYKSTQ